MLNFLIGCFIGNLISLLVVLTGFFLNKESSSEDIDNF